MKNERVLYDLSEKSVSKRLAIRFNCKRHLLIEPKRHEPRNLKALIRQKPFRPFTTAERSQSDAAATAVPRAFGNTVIEGRGAN